MLNLSDFDLSGRRALVTGGSDGLGRQFSEALLDAGASVVICSRRKDSLEETAAELAAKFPGRISFQVCDVTEKSDVDRLGVSVGHIDILVNNAGLAHRAKWDVEQSEEWRKIMVLNLESPFWLSQKFMPSMIAQGWGRVINISSICGVSILNPDLYPGLGADMPSYFASKHGLVGLTKFLATQVAEFGVTVNAICPGLFDSPANRVVFQPGPLLDAVSKATPARRIGTDRELRTALLFLAAPGSSFVTGQSLVVDGGWTTW
ncbi:MAG: SDR family oxidoreductase [Actinobacteria bacterium]|nr:SDR family oxidoreductase [Actinomycetota bacterium]